MNKLYFIGTVLLCGILTLECAAKKESESLVSGASSVGMNSANGGIGAGTSDSQFESMGWALIQALRHCDYQKVQAIPLDASVQNVTEEQFKATCEPWKTPGIDYSKAEILYKSKNESELGPALVELWQLNAGTGFITIRFIVIETEKGQRLGMFRARQHTSKSTVQLSLIQEMAKVPILQLVASMPKCDYNATKSLFGAELLTSDAETAYPNICAMFKDLGTMKQYEILDFGWVGENKEAAAFKVQLTYATSVLEGEITLRVDGDDLKIIGIYFEPKKQLDTQNN